MKHRTNFNAAIAAFLIALLWHLPLLAQTPATPGQPLSVDTSGRVKRDFKIPSGKTLQWESGSTFRIDDGTSFNIGSTAASAMRTAIGELNGIKIFTNTANRDASTPGFVGQIGFQLDSESFYYGTATTVGQWSGRLNTDWLSGAYLSVSNTDGGEAANFTGEAGVANFTRSATTTDPAVFINNDAGTGPALRLEGTAGDMLQIRDGGTLAVKATIDKAGVFLAGDGTVGAPGLSFYSDTDTGIYRTGANTVGVAAAGALVASFSGTGLSVSGPIAGTTGTFSGAISGASASLTTPLPLASGGTGAATAAAARSALSIGRPAIVTQNYTAAAGYTPAAFTANARNKIALNTVVSDPDSIVTFSDANDQITLAAGTYVIRARTGCIETSSTLFILRNSTDSTDTAAATAYYAQGYNAAGQIELETRVTISGSKTYQLEIVPQAAGYTAYISGALTLPSPAPTLQLTTVIIEKE